MFKNLGKIRYKINSQRVKIDLQTIKEGVNFTEEFIIYAWHSVEGYSKIGGYEGNGNADGPFIYTGFKPAWLIVKNADVGSAGYAWYMWDGKRPGYNVNNELFINDTSTQNTGFDRADFLSNGFKIRNTGAAINGNGSTMIYMAFAETPSAFTNSE